MEAAGIAWVCSLFSKPLICVKAITDIVDGGRQVFAFVCVCLSLNNVFLEDGGSSTTRLKPPLLSHLCRPSHEEFLENLSTAATSLQNAVPKVLEFVKGRKTSEL